MIRENFMRKNVTTFCDTTKNLHENVACFFCMNFQSIVKIYKIIENLKFMNFSSIVNFLQKSLKYNDGAGGTLVARAHPTHVSNPA